MMPLLRRLLYYGLGCNKPGNKEQSLQAIDSVFKEVGIISLVSSSDFHFDMSSHTPRSAVEITGTPWRSFVLLCLAACVYKHLFLEYTL